MRLFRAFFALALVLALAVTAAGCGGGDDGEGAQDWADGVCTELNTWADGVSITITRVMAQGRGVTVTDLRAAANQSSAATSRLIAGLRGVGAPDTDTGEAAQEEIGQLADNLEMHARNARDLVHQDTPTSVSGLIALAGSLLQEVGAAADEAQATLDTLEALGADLRTGIAESDTCTDLRERDFAVG